MGAAAWLAVDPTRILEVTRAQGVSEMQMLSSNRVTSVEPRTQ